MSPGDLFENPKIQMMLRNFLKYKTHAVFDVICDNHLAIFYPLPYFEVSVINNVFSNLTESAQSNASKIN